jgi:hypothetical protein
LKPNIKLWKFGKDVLKNFTNLGHFFIQKSFIRCKLYLCYGNFGNWKGGKVDIRKATTKVGAFPRG